MARKHATRKQSTRAKARPAKRRTSQSRGARRKAKPTKKAKKTRRKPKVAPRKVKVAKSKTSAVRKVAASKPARRAAASAPAQDASSRQPKPPHSTRLERQRRTLPDVELGTLPEDRQLAAARTGHEELGAALRKHTANSPELTAGDIDADWQDAYAIGDETPGGDNPTPDQNRVDLIGKAIGTEYADDQELEGGDEIRKRDKKRWELDPASSEDWPHDKRK